MINATLSKDLYWQTKDGLSWLALGPRSRPSRIFVNIKDALEMTGKPSCEWTMVSDLPRGRETQHVRLIHAPLGLYDTF